MYALTLILIGQLPPAMPPLPVSINLPAMQVAELPAPVVEGPSAGVPTSTAAFVAYPRVPLARSQSCAGGFCQPAAAPKQYQYQSRSSQPRRLFSGRLFGRR
jgi:hypothetical protein